MTVNVVFASGKGGVGKSTVALNVAVALAQEGIRVGLIDADIYGPDIPAMVGITRRTPATSITLWQAQVPAVEPVEHLGVKIMSAQFLIAEDQPLDWQMPLVGLLMRRLVHDVTWGELDLLLVDVPPGTGDLQQELFTLLADPWVVLVVTPQYSAHLDGRKLVSMLQRRNIRIFGGVENMTGLDCPSCGAQMRLFEQVSEEYAIWSQGVGRLAEVPFTPADVASNAHTPLVLAAPDAPASWQLLEVARKIRSVLL
ncbi:P-loop NTPase [Actinopolymorpha alba]|uniref:P-loop NTPase n=1 Tax=Actinopolymorpha alba TaxID=533267 RepID=UPI0003692A00|nr:P-loop NTPase [Actinopolymorpha alba]